MGFEPTTLRDLVGCSNHLSYWMVLSMWKSAAVKSFTQFHEVELDETMLLKINSAQWSEQESIEEEIMGVLTDDK